MLINSIAAVGGLDRLAVYSTDFDSDFRTRVSPDPGEHYPHTASAVQGPSSSSFSAQLAAAIERIKFENEKLLIREDNASEAEERVRNIAEAEDAIQLASYKILAESESAMWAQANLLPQSAFHLLG